MEARCNKIVKRKELDNGLQLLGEVSGVSRSASLGFFVRTGSRDERARESGLSHFLEHMMFKGTAKRSALELTYALGSIGAQANACTSEECTVFYGAVMPEHFGSFQEILSDMLRPCLDAVEFETEKKVILEEIALYQDRPQFWLYEQSCLDYFAGHPAGNSVLGTNDSISRSTPEDMRAYFNRRYVPSNMVCVAAGNFDWEAFVSRAEAFCGGWPRGAAERELKPGPEVDTRRVFKRKNIKQAHVLLLGRGASAQDDDRYALNVLAAVLGDSSGSKLYWQLVDRGLAESAGCESDDRDRAGLFSVFASTQPDKVDEILSVIKSVLASPLDFSEAELEQAKAKLAARLVFGGELPMGRLMSLGAAWLYRKEVHDLRRSLERLRSVSAKDIESAVEKYGLSKWGEYLLMPEE